MLSTRKFVAERSVVQRGLVTRADLRGAGVPDHQRFALQQEGSLVLVGRHTYRHGARLLDDHGRVLAACLDAGGVASHQTAAWLHGLPGFGPGDPPEVLVAGRKSDYRFQLARVHSTTWLPTDDLVTVDAIACTSVARTLFSLAALAPQLSIERVRGAVDEAVRLRLATDKWLWWRLEKLRCRGRNGVSNFEAVLTARAGGSVTESWLEREFLRLLDAAGLERPVCQARIAARGAFVARADFLYERARVIVEVTGAVGHSTPAQRAADARRRNRLARLGYVVLEFTYEQVVGEPTSVAEEVESALRGLAVA